MKERILQQLRSGRLSTSRIAGILGMNYGYASKYLEELEKEGKVKRMKETLVCYWEIRKEVKK